MCQFFFTQRCAVLIFHILLCAYVRIYSICASTLCSASLHYSTDSTTLAHIRNTHYAFDVHVHSTDCEKSEIIIISVQNTLSRFNLHVTFNLLQIENISCTSLCIDNTLFKSSTLPFLSPFVFVTCTHTCIFPSCYGTELLHKHKEG